MRNIEQLVDRQVREWDVRAAGRHTSPGRRQKNLVLALSRQVGSGGGDIARAVAETLGYPVFDKEILGYIARSARSQESLVKLLDEQAQNWLEESLGTLFGRSHISHSEYIEHLSRAVFAISEQDGVVIIGRGAEYILPVERRLAVRVVAPVGWRVERLLERQGGDERQVRDRLLQEDAERDAFLRGTFGHAIDDLGAHDLVLNASRFSVADAVEIIVTAYRAV